jgi:hypothetical protein
MPDNTLMGSTDTIRTKDRTTYKTPASLIDVTDGVAAELLGLVAPDIVWVDSTGLTTSVTAYSIGDVLGAEFTFTVCRAAGRGSVITHAMLLDAANIVGAVDLYLFKQASTPAADNAANSWSDANRKLEIGKIQFETPATPSALNRDAIATNGLPLVVKGNSSTDIKGTLVTRTAHTFFGAASDLTVVLGFEPA